MSPLLITRNSSRFKLFYSFTFSFFNYSEILKRFRYEILQKRNLEKPLVNHKEDFFPLVCTEYRDSVLVFLICTKIKFIFSCSSGNISYY